MYNIQRDFNYGFRSAEIHRLALEDGPDSQAIVPYNPLMNPDIKPQHTQVDFGGVNTYFYRFYGGQPFFRLDTESFDDPTIKSNYDEIIQNFAGNDAEVAFDILQTIETNKGLTTDIQGQARTLLIFLTQVIEAHSTRIPGADKLARALLRRIALGQLTFKEAFNRKNGLFVSAWAPGAGAKKGGQIAGRALFGMAREKDKYESDSLEKDLGEERFGTLMDTVEDYYSDDSDEEGEEDRQEYLSMNSLTLKSVNGALSLLGISLSVASSHDLLKLPAFEKEVNDSYRKLSAQYHPDKMGDSQKFTEVAQAAGILRQWISELKENKDVDLSGKELNTLMQQNGVRLQKIDGTGNCFYDAVLDQIAFHGGNVPSALTLRDRIAQLIIDNAATFQVFVTGNQLNQIVESILTNHSWNNAGGDFAPQLIASVLRRPVRIIQPDGVIDMAPRNDLNLTQHNTLNTGNGLITIIYNGNNHYDSTRQNFLM
jgi:DnaJ-class molecular chaperone with C-terminal Zn finger domain